LYCKGAGDYVEVVKTNETILHSGSLNALLNSLPESFIKVHRSYVVNAKYIAQLTRLPSGTGEITLSHMLKQNVEKIPVSRRLLPALKTSLKNQ
jgi:DNA-binding LytR/AlgR family response regulator